MLIRHKNDFEEKFGHNLILRQKMLFRHENDFSLQMSFRIQFWKST